MARPAHIVRPIKVHITLPEDLKAKIDLFLYSESERRVPVGAYAKFFAELVEEKLKKVSLDDFQLPG